MRCIYSMKILYRMCDFDISHQLIKIANIRSSAYSITTIGCALQIKLCMCIVFPKVIEQPHPINKQFFVCIYTNNTLKYSEKPNGRAHSCMMAWMYISFCHVLNFKITNTFHLIFAQKHYMMKYYVDTKNHTHTQTHTPNNKIINSFAFDPSIKENEELKFDFQSEN